jgi:hypothetical protein
MFGGCSERHYNSGGAGNNIFGLKVPRHCPLVLLGPMLLPVLWELVAVSPVLKRPERKAHRSPRLVPMLTMQRNLHLHVFMSWCLIKPRYNFTVYFSFRDDILDILNRHYHILLQFLDSSYSDSVFNVLS